MIRLLLLPFLAVLAFGQTPTSSVPVQVFNGTSESVLVYFDFDGGISQSILGPNESTQVYFRRSAVLSNWLEVETLLGGQRVFAVDVTPGASTTGYAYYCYETGSGYSYVWYPSTGQDPDPDSVARYGLAVFLSGMGLAATVRLTRTGLRWVRSLGDHGAEAS